MASLVDSQGYQGSIDIPFYSADYGYGRFILREDPLNQSPLNLNHPYSALHLNTGIINDDTRLKNSFWYASKRSSEPWRDAKWELHY